jgi:transposase-like protein/HPt (histidine-containing phosphotransfer) domain-containing protein
MKCPKCGSTHIRKNGKRGEKQNHICADCGRQFIDNYSVLGYSQDVKKICLKMYCNGMGFRQIERCTDVSHNSVINWVKDTAKQLPEHPPIETIPKPSNSSINLAIFTSIENAVGKENLSEVIDNYFSQAEREISNMRAAFNNQDIVTLEANNHSLKGGSGLFGATKLLKFCRSLQFMCRICIESNEYASNDVDQIGIVLQNIEEEYDLVKQALKALQ